ncbi:MAG: DNA primase [Lachnospiraceae bacterium]|nr:DNA primase [bacterium]MDY5518539.1 DNA primase [Lachnospiraceae bacterium]
MPLYSDDLVEEVRSRSDIVDVISQYVKLHKRGSNYVGLCPFHNEKTGSFTVSASKQMYYCFGCGAGGNVITFLMNYENETFPEVLQELADRAGVELPKQEVSPEAKQQADKRSRLLEVQKEAAKYYYALLRSPRGRQAYEYFHKRELSDETMRKFGLGYSDKYSDDLYLYLKNKGYEDSLLKDSGLVSFDERHGGHDKFWNRAMFPIMDMRGKVIGFGGRVMGEGEPKYLNSPETQIFDKSRNLYALHIAKSTKKPQMLLCEGYMDVIALHQAGFDNAVASLGTAFTTGHASLLKRYTKEVYLTFDSDGAGIKAALRAIPILKEVGLTAKVIHMEPYKDPDEFIKALGAEEFQKRIDNAENSFFFELRVLEQNYDMRDPESKTAFHNEVARRLLGFSEELERENYITATAERYHIGYEQLRRLVNTLGAKGIGAKPQENPTQLKSGMNHKNKREDGNHQAQKLLLTWLVDRPELYEQIRYEVSPEDFTEELYRKVATLLYDQYKKGAVNPAQIISTFSDEEEQRTVAGLFHARLPELTSVQEQEKALRDVIARIRRDSLEAKKEQVDVTSLEDVQRFIEAAKASKR